MKTENQKVLSCDGSTFEFMTNTSRLDLIQKGYRINLEKFNNNSLNIVSLTLFLSAAAAILPCSVSLNGSRGAMEERW